MISGSSTTTPMCYSTAAMRRVTPLRLVPPTVAVIHLFVDHGRPKAPCQ
jgi:hypothetical protein